MDDFAGPAFDIATGRGEPAVAALESGEFVVVYTGVKDVLARVYTPEGARSSGEIAVDMDDEWVNQPDVTGLAGGGFVVVWPGERTPEGGPAGDDYDPLFRVFDERALAVTSVKGAEAPDGDNEFETRVTPYGNGFAMVWTADNDDGSPDDAISDGIAGRFFSAIGTPENDTEWINDSRAEVQRDASAATLDDGSMVFAYQSWDGNNVLVRTYDANAQPFGAERIASATTEGNQFNPEVAALAEDDRFVVIWDHNSATDSQDGIRAQIFETSGTGPGRDFAPSGDEIVVTMGRAGESHPHVAGIGGGGFVALWLEQTGTTNEFGGRIRDIKAQFYDAAGQVVGEELTVFTGYFGTEVTFDVAENELGALMAVWTESRDVGEGSFVNEVMGRILNVPVTAEEIEGTPGPDRLDGTAGADTILGLDGDDLLRGMAGDDLLKGGDGTDTINGGDGDDLIRGGDTDADRRDVIYAGAGDDSVDGGYGNDLIFGQGGNDTIAGGFGADELQGQDGDDVITGSAFGDIVFGNAGNDFVNGGFGHDLINGGTGADKFFHTGGSREQMEGHGSDWVQDYSSAEGDVLVFGGAGTADQFQVNTTHTANKETGERSGDDSVEEAFVIYKPTGQILWALVDGGGEASINLQIGAEVFDLLA